MQVPSCNVCAWSWCAVMPCCLGMTSGRLGVTFDKHDHVPNTFVTWTGYVCQCDCCSKSSVHFALRPDSSVRCSMLKWRHCKLLQTQCRQGEQGDNFYVIQSGHFKATKTEGASEKLLFNYHNQGAFGELALMYNCPRAASVTVSSNCPMPSIVLSLTSSKHCWQ